MEPAPSPEAGTAAAPAAFSLPPTRQRIAWIAISAVRQLRGLVLPFGIILLTRNRDGEGGGFAVFALLTVAALLWQLVSWWSLTYAVTDGNLVVESGVLSRRERVVPLPRVQAVDLTETPLQRLFGVVGMRIETAAGGGRETDVVLEAVRRADAEELRANLLAARGPAPVPSPAGAGETAALPPEGELVFSLSWRDVLAAGATSGRIAPALAVLVFVSQAADDVLPEAVWTRIADALPGFGLRGALAVLAAGAAFAWLLAIGGAALTWANFEVRRQGDRLAVSHGLLDRRRRSVPLARIQAIVVEQGMLRRPFGLAEVRFLSAAWGKDAADSGMLAPVIPADRALELAAAVAPDLVPAGPLPPFVAPPPRALRPYVGNALRQLAAVLVAALVVAAVLPNVRWQWGALALVLAPALLLGAVLAHRETGFAREGARALFREGGLTARLTLTRVARIQRRGTAASVFQRRAGLATLRASLAAGGGRGAVSLRHLDAGDADRIVAGLAPGAAASFPSSHRDRVRDGG